MMTSMINHPPSIADLNLAASLPEALRGGRDQGGGKELKKEVRASEQAQVADGVSKSVEKRLKGTPCFEGI